MYKKERTALNNVMKWAVDPAFPPKSKPRIIFHTQYLASEQTLTYLIADILCHGGAHRYSHFLLCNVFQQTDQLGKFSGIEICLYLFVIII